MRSTAEFLEESCHRVRVGIESVFSWDYGHADEALVRLYDKAKRSQWNSAEDLNWSVEVDPSRPDRDGTLALVGAPESPFARLDEAGRRELAWESQAWMVSQFLHGEQGALLASARIVETVPDGDAKLYAATQVMDEARHVEVYGRYLAEKVQRSYPVNPALFALLENLLADSRWDMTYLGMQIMVESLALAAFGFVYQTTEEPLLRSITGHVMGDEARHVAFGVLSLQGVYDAMPDAERREREDFVCEAAALMRDRLLMRDVWARVGLPVEDCARFVRDHPLQQQFRRLLFARVVPNVKRIGLLSPRVRRSFEQLGILEFESLPASA
jgi:hypothetical protein